MIRRKEVERKGELFGRGEEDRAVKKKKKQSKCELKIKRN